MITAGILLSNCGINANDNLNDGTITHEEHQQEKESQPIELNNGAKWSVNSEMIPYVLEGEKLLNQYDGTDYSSLAVQLKEKNNGLIQACTMGGKSHEELHKWLHPHLQLVDKLEVAENKQQADKIIGDLKKSFQTYNKYFE